MNRRTLMTTAAASVMLPAPQRLLWYSPIPVEDRFEAAQLRDLVAWSGIRRHPERHHRADERDGGRTGRHARNDARGRQAKARAIPFRDDRNAFKVRRTTTPAIGRWRRCCGTCCGLGRDLGGAAAMCIPPARPGQVQYRIDSCRADC